MEAYSSGWFPMGDGRGAVEWFSPDPRGIIPLERFHVPARLSRTLRQSSFEIRVDSAFRATMDACAARGETWMTPVILDSYERLFDAGHAHSVEVWRDASLVGGLYGVSLGAAFFGESMFHRVTDASKAALCALVDRLRERSYELLDIQWVTPHLEQFGAVEIARDEYLTRLARSLREARSFR